MRVNEPPSVLGSEYTFSGVDSSGGYAMVIPVLEIRVTELPREGAAGIPQPRSLDQYEAQFRAKRGALVTRLTSGSYGGLEIDDTTRGLPPSVTRIFQTQYREYWLEWDPDLEHATELASTFSIP